MLCRLGVKCVMVMVVFYFGLFLLCVSFLVSYLWYCSVFLWMVVVLKGWLWCVEVIICWK